MSFATAVCWGSFLFVTGTIDPQFTNWLGFSLFYFSLFLSILGTSAILGFIIRFVGLKHELAFRSVKAAFRQSFLFSFLIVSVLFLLSKNLLNWLNLILLIIALTILEFFMISYSQNNLRKINSADLNNFENELK